MYDKLSSPRFYERVFSNNTKNCLYIELIGTVIHVRDKYFKLLDYTNLVEIYKNSELILEKDRYAVQCKIYNNNVLFCVSARKISFYEEVYYWIEISEKYKRDKECNL